jgi:hypothetical protein
MTTTIADVRHVVQLELSFRNRQGWPAADAPYPETNDG